ncbi:MAG: hypothetical protein ACP5NK_04485 [Thermoplasmata archaeon]
MHNLLLIIFIEAIMTLIITYFVYYTIEKSEAFQFRNYSFVAIILTMMAGMLGSFTIYVSTPYNFFDTILALSFSMFTMAIVVSALLWMVTSETKFSISGAGYYAIVLLLLWNEISMGVFSYILAYGIDAATGGRDTVFGFIQAMSTGINSVFFIVPMAAEMIFLIFLIKPRIFYALIFTSILFMGIADPAIGGIGSLVPIGLIASAAVMLLYMVAVVVLISRKISIFYESDVPVLTALFAIYAFISAGLFVGALNPFSSMSSWIVNAFSMLVSMGFYFILTVRRRDKQIISPLRVLDNRVVGTVLVFTFISGLLSVMSIAVYFVPSLI